MRADTVRRASLQVCARYPGVIKQILTHHAYTALYLLPPTDRPVTLSAFRSTIRDDDKGTAPQENHTMVNLMTAGACIVLYMWNEFIYSHLACLQVVLWCTCARVLLLMITPPTRGASYCICLRFHGRLSFSLL